MRSGKWHLSPKTEKWEPCEANTKPCPYPDAPHECGTLEEVIAKWAKQQGIDTIPKTKKNFLHETDFTIELPDTKKLARILAEKQPGEWKFGENHLVCTLFQLLYEAAKLDPAELVDKAVDQLKKIIKEKANNTFVSSQLVSEMVEHAVDEIATQVISKFVPSLFGTLNYSTLFEVLALETCPDHNGHEGMANIEQEVGNSKTYLKCPPLEKS